MRGEMLGGFGLCSHCRLTAVGHVLIVTGLLGRLPSASQRFVAPRGR